MAFIMSRPTHLTQDDIAAMRPSKSDIADIDRAVERYERAERRAASARRQMREAQSDYDALLLRVKAAGFDRLRHEEFARRQSQSTATSDGGASHD